jgi:NADPH-dependent ferric siderophore reductase
MHFLIVGEAADLPLIRRMLDRLPVDGYGQVFVEVATGYQVTELSAPEGVAVTWLVRNHAGSFRPNGEMAAGAVLAWIAEWMPDEDGNDAPYVIWVGGPTRTVMERLHVEIGDRIHRLHLHHPHVE